VERDRVLGALEAEGARAAEVMLAAGEDDFERPTRCDPWTVRALVAHLLVAGNRLPAMLVEPEPSQARVSAAGYYRPDERFGRGATRSRITTAIDDAATFTTGHALAEAFDGACREMVALARAEPPGRLVRTRWGDAMSLSDFLVTRVAELAIHGLDLADGLGRTPWLTAPAADVVEWLLLGGTPIDSVPGLGWDQRAVIEAATGRRPVTGTERALLAGHGVRRLTFG